MAKKTFSFNCENQHCQQLASILQHYIDAAFPPGGSECAQATREALQAVQQNLSRAENTSIVAISIRQRSLLKACINWYFTDVDPDNQQHQQDLLQKIKKRPA